MPNMHYCRFENTLEDLRECAGEWEVDKHNGDEIRARRKLYELCEQIVNDYEDFEDYEYLIEDDD